MIRASALAAALLLAPAAAPALTCNSQSFEETRFTLCAVTPSDDLRLFLSGPDGPWGSPDALAAGLEAQGLTLRFAMNAGMFDENLAPIGLYRASGTETAPIVTREGPGNFGMLPNGVFCFGSPDRPFAVTESRAFAETGAACPNATQSGPLLVQSGALHPRLLPDSDSVKYRNGVGVTADGQRAVFVISDDPVNFHRFARFFRDRLGLPDALYLDGTISRLYAPALGRDDAGWPVGPMVGVVAPKE